MEETILKKRGRKPKGGKITSAKVNKPTSTQPSFSPLSTQTNEILKPNVILHLKCCKKDLKKDLDTVAGYGHGESQFLSYNSLVDDECMNSNNNIYEKFMTITHQINHHPIDLLKHGNDNDDDSNNPYNVNDDDEGNVENVRNDDEIDDDDESVLFTKSINKKLTKKELKHINMKLKNLDYNLHVNHVINNNSACFWCTCTFNDTPVFLPKGYVKDILQVYGCFCSPQCAVGYLMKENLDSSTRFERYSLLHHMYSSAYDYETTIKPAPCPFYTLNKYLGNLTIDEYRNLSTKTIMLKIDKPITRILPEFHQDNDDYILTSKLISSNNNAVSNSSSNNNGVSNNSSSLLNSSFKKNKISLLFTK
jgi:hypothetical protein